MNSKMKLPGESVVIDLSPVNRLDQLFEALGKAFDLGGPGGNTPVPHDVDGKGWGQNWNALADSLLCLDSGGIWGTSRRFKFPLYVDFQNASHFRIADPAGYATLCEVLAETRESNLKHGLEFRVTVS